MVDWLCLPSYAGATLFGSLLDSDRGGWWRLGPASDAAGQQWYLENSTVLVTTWTENGWVLELTDAMARPWDDREAGDGGEDGRVLQRRLRCLEGDADSVFDLCPRPDFAAATIATSEDGASISLGEDRRVDLWASQPVTIDGERAVARFQLTAGEEMWAVLATGEEIETT